MTVTSPESVCSPPEGAAPPAPAGTIAGLLDDVTLDQLCTFLDGRGLMRQKWPERLVVVDDFPLTGLGKVAKADLARQIAGDD